MIRKIKFIGWLFRNYILNLGKRIKILYLHLIRFTKGFRFLNWLVELLFLLLDLIGLPEILQAIYILLNWNLRFLENREKEELSPIFNQKIPLEYVLLNPKSIIARRMKIAFVSFNIIHFDKKITYPLLVHEMVHVWQYQQFGSVYILRSLKAQRSKEGYDYGGPINLSKKSQNGYSLLDFNFEQMCEIIKDAYLLNYLKGYSNLKNLYNGYIKFLQNYSI